MKLVDIIHSLRKQFPQKERYGLWSQLLSAVESTPLLIAEGYGRRTAPDRAHFMDQAIASNLEAKTACQISVRKGHVTPKGFTLVEILVVVGILGIIIIIASNMFFTILRGSTKTRVLTEVKQNGNYALAVMERMIRNARGIENCDKNKNYIRVQNPDKEWTKFLCCESPSLIASSSGNLACGDEGVEDERLTNDKVAVSNCDNFINCSQSVGGPPVVTINFTLSQPGIVARPEEKASVDFKTMVTLRNY